MYEKAIFQNKFQSGAHVGGKAESNGARPQSVVLLAKGTQTTLLWQNNGVFRSSFLMPTFRGRAIVLSFAHWTGTERTIMDYLFSITLVLTCTYAYVVDSENHPTDTRVNFVHFIIYSL